MALKIDIKKVFDSMRWSFIPYVLSAFGFLLLFVLGSTISLTQLKILSSSTAPPMAILVVLIGFAKEIPSPRFYLI